VNAKFALARYNPESTQYATFGASGAVLTDLTPYADGAQGIVIQPDGKIVAAGFGGSEFALARYLAS
jgi:Domain of unknown function (DUF5122) beta-propeller